MRTCKGCGDSGDCKACDGKGKKMTSSTLGYDKCQRCDGKGQCTVCHGTGKS